MNRFLLSCVLLLSPSFAYHSPLVAQTAPACPTKPGVYVQTGAAWTELPQEADPLIVQKMNAFTGLVYDKEFAGDEAFTSLQAPKEFCAVGTSTATFSLEKAKVKKGKNRTIVQTGNYHDKKGDQSQQLAVITDEQGNVHLKCHDLIPGQYVLTVHGVISKPIKTPSPTGNPTSDAVAQAIANSAAIAGSFTLGGGGIYFGFGIK